jgi:putative membrane protein insertion efficiency factor
VFQRLLIGLVQGYRYLLSPWLGSSCRFEPTCSVYALAALRRHGAADGARLTASRLLRCHPWCAGGVDAVPSDAPPLFSSLLDRARRPAPLAPSTGGPVPSRKNPP